MAKKCLRQKSTPINEHLILSLWRISALSCFLFPDKEVFFINKKKGPQGKKANFRTWKLPPHPTPQPSKKNFLKMGFFCSFIFHLWYFFCWFVFHPPVGNQSGFPIPTSLRLTYENELFLTLDPLTTQPQLFHLFQVFGWMSSLPNSFEYFMRFKLSKVFELL